jgi:hypothetical protein
VGWPCIAVDAVLRVAQPTVCLLACLLACLHNLISSDAACSRMLSAGFNQLLVAIREKHERTCMLHLLAAANSCISSTSKHTSIPTHPLAGAAAVHTHAHRHHVHLCSSSRRPL